jgi:hypothetical protein
MYRPLLMSAAAAFAFTASQAFAQAVINFPPAGSHSFVALYEAGGPPDVCVHVQCQIVGDPSVSTSMAPVTFLGPNPEFITGSGSTGPDAMHAFLSANVFAEVDTAFDDTYTVHGGTAPFSITVTMNAHGTASTLPFSTNNIAIGSLTGIIGTFDINPTHLLPTVDAFAQANSGLIDLQGPVPQTAQANLSVSYTRIVNPGDVFDLAYELETNIVGTLDASHTAEISFTLPDGVFLTAASGATFGAVTPPAGGVPEPASWALMIAGFGLAGAALRRRGRSLLTAQV